MTRRSLIEPTLQEGKEEGLLGGPAGGTQKRKRNIAGGLTPKPAYFLGDSNAQEYKVDQQRGEGGGGKKNSRRILGKTLRSTPLKEGGKKEKKGGWKHSIDSGCHISC